MIVALSGNLIASLEAEISQGEQACIAHCFLESAEEMRLVYAKYLQQHPNIAAIAKSVSFSFLLF